ncbi:MAG: hypothetical protein V1928_03800 [Parcubacteria group bacterium]
MKKSVLGFVFLCSCLLFAACDGGKTGCGNLCGRNEVCDNGRCYVRCTNDYTCIHDLEAGPSFECDLNAGYCVKRSSVPNNYPTVSSDGGLAVDGGVSPDGGSTVADGGTIDAGIPDAGWSPCGLTVEQMRTDANHCGNCETKCNLPNATSKCVAGACVIDKCEVGKKDCDNNPATGCESDSATDVNNCRTCGRVCDFEFSGEFCDDGMCVPTTCNQDRGECNPHDSVPCETELPSDVENCGRCGRSCNDVYPHSMTFCLDRTCEWANCRTGWGACNANVRGCNTNLFIDNANCGECGAKCDIPNTYANCESGACVPSRCKEGFADSDNNLLNGCEIDLRNDVHNCGFIDNSCEAANVSAMCINGMCVRTGCEGDYVTCPMDAAQCGTNIRIDSDNCGGCGIRCSALYPNMDTTCNNAVCIPIACLAPYMDCRWQPGCETNTDTNMNHCGNCDVKCEKLNAYATCEGGECIALRCKEGFADADNNLNNGCEIDLTKDSLNCGRLDNDCARTNVATMCVNGFCTPTGCDANYATCPTSALLCDIHLSVDTANCGSCGYNCESVYPGSNVACNNSRCDFVSCKTGKGACDPNARGCTIDLLTNNSHCGQCNAKCDIPNVYANCESGACVPSRCKEGFADADNNLLNGCEINLREDSNNCGEVGHNCAFTNASSMCVNGMCVPTGCDAGYATCPLSSNVTYCGINLTTDAANCGSCGYNCESVYPGMVVTCTDSVCVPTGCKDGKADCKAAQAGCETDITNDDNNCNGCGNKCVFTNGIGVCLLGSCAFVGCEPGYYDLDGLASNGCEIDLTKDSNNCGEAGHNCAFTNASSMCVNSVCVPTGCDAGYATCASSSNPAYCATYLPTDTANCGSCGYNCETVYPGMVVTCADSVCVPVACKDGKADCKAAHAGCETDTTSDVNNCGGCGIKCDLPNGNSACENSLCVFKGCNPGFADCDLNLINGCEVDLTSNVAFCGRCTKSCSFANSGAVCTDGVCTPTTCDLWTADCDANMATNGCETNLLTDAKHCGSCATACGFDNAGSVCTNAVCQMGTCNAGYLDCNGRQNDGCEINKMTDPNNCGVCGTVCGSGSSCVNGVCQASGTPGTPLPAVTSITCSICCPTGLGSPVVWYGAGPPDTMTWTPASGGSCGILVMQAGTFCKRGLHPTYSAAFSGWFTYNCNATWSGATANDVSTCVDQNGNALTFHDIAGVVNTSGVREVAIEQTCHE